MARAPMDLWGQGLARIRDRVDRGLDRARMVPGLTVQARAPLVISAPNQISARAPHSAADLVIHSAVASATRSAAVASATRSAAVASATRAAGGFGDPFGGGGFGDPFGGGGFGDPFGGGFDTPSAVVVLTTPLASMTPSVAAGLATPWISWGTS